MAGPPYLADHATLALSPPPPSPFWMSLLWLLPPPPNKRFTTKVACLVMIYMVVPPYLEPAKYKLATVKIFACQRYIKLRFVEKRTGLGFEPPTSPIYYGTLTNWDKWNFVTKMWRLFLLCRLSSGTEYLIGPRRDNFAPNSDPKEATGSWRWVLQLGSIHSVE